MRLVPVLMFLWVLAPRTAVYVKGHSHAADKVRENIETFTCYSSRSEPENSDAILQVDHILATSGRSWVVMVLTDSQHNVLYKRKAEEYPWPIPSSLDRLLRSMAKSTCPGFQTSRIGESPAHQGRGAPSRSQIPKDALILHGPN
jgi:hypothetical protein